jgi:two-component system cell cycle sensor histidine kinase/response regulator CckA
VNTILVVEDNPITRKMMRVALETDGHLVIEAGDGNAAMRAAADRNPDLIILDYVLPDTDGLRLMRDLRQLLGRENLPALLVTGMISRLEELRGKAGENTQFLAKPIAPSHLLEVVRVHLGATSELGAGQLVLVVDNEPVNLKLAALRLTHQGYTADTASGGFEALEKARARRPDAVLAHAGMPSMDGFSLCREFRRDPRLTAIPIVLFSSAYIEEVDRQLARKMGASELVARTADLGFALDGLRRALQGEAAFEGATAAEEADVALDALYRERLHTQLDRRTAQNRALQREAGIQASALALLRSLSEVLGRPTNVPEVIGDVLVECLDAAGLSTGLLYFVEAEDRYRLQAHSGLGAEQRDDAERCFGHPEILQSIVAAGRPVALFLQPPGATPDPTSDLLTRLGRSSVLCVPFVVMGKAFGVLVLASEHQDLADASWVGFAECLAMQFGQTVALGQSLTRLAASELSYAALMEQASDAIVILDREDRVRAANRSALHLLGRPSREVVGEIYDVFVEPSELDESRRCRSRLDSEGQVRVALRRLVRGDGSLVSVELTESMVRTNGEATVLLILRDITERLRLEAQIQQAQKLESIGRLAGGIAHDFNNLLTVILGYGSVALSAAVDRPSLRQNLEEIIRAGESAAGLTRQLLAFSRQQVLMPTVIDVSALIRKLERMLPRLIGEDVELVTELDVQPCLVRADANQIEQVVMNLVVNARDAMPQGGRLVLSTRNCPLDAGTVARVDSTAPAFAEVALSVADSGTGIDSTVMPHLFDPFFTTKEEGKGTGLGLATVYGIVQQSGGRLEVISEAGEGATFTVYLPRTSEPLVPVFSPVSSSAGGHETILVVEDDACILMLERTIMLEHGYVVLTATNAAEALKLADDRPEPIDLLLTDVIIPGTSGVLLAETMKGHRPGLRVIFTSGYSDRALNLDSQGFAFLQKPFEPSALLRQIRASLDQ